MLFATRNTMCTFRLLIKFSFDLAFRFWPCGYLWDPKQEQHKAFRNTGLSGSRVSVRWYAKVLKDSIFYCPCYFSTFLALI